MNQKTLHELAEQAGFDIIDGEICAPDPDGGCEDEIIRLLELLQTEHQQPAVASTRPVDRYILLYAEAEELLAQLREQHESNYGIEPSEVNWGDVGSLSNFVEVLQFAVRSLPNRPT